MTEFDPIEEDPRVPFRTVLLSAAGLWLCYFILATVRWEMYGLGFTAEMAERRAIVSLAGVIVTLGLWLLLRLFDRRALWMKIVAALLISAPVSVLLADINLWAFADVSAEMEARFAKDGSVPAQDDNSDPLADVPLSGEEPAEAMPIFGFAVQLSEIAYGRYFMMLAWCALYLALLTGEKARAAERREGEFRRAAKAAELRSLRYQVNPHFLFNTLNSLSALVLTGRTEAAEKMIQTISTFYRRSLANDPTADVPLREEFALQRLYLEIEGVRFPERLVTKFDLPAELADLLVPGMILQPLVENSVKHAVSASAGKVTITVSAREEYGRVVVSVSDNGRNGPDTDIRPGFGIGLNNVRQRLEARFGREAGIVSGPVQGGYATHLRMPIIGKSDDRD
jgi:hypothetical protein